MWHSPALSDAILTKFRAQGNIFNLISCCCAIGLALGLTFYCKWENRQRDLGRRDHRLEGKTEQEIKDLGWKHPSYRLKI